MSKIVQKLQQNLKLNPQQILEQNIIQLSVFNLEKRILEELEKAAQGGKGAAQIDGRMIDAASARMAENIVNIHKLINNK